MGGGARVLEEGFLGMGVVCGEGCGFEERFFFAIVARENCEID